MEQHFISNFKKLYIQALFQRCFEMTSETQLNLRYFWKDTFQYTPLTEDYRQSRGLSFLQDVQSSWTNFWPASISARDLEEPEQNVAVVEEIVPLGMSMGLEVDSEDLRSWWKTTMLN
jgi:hypothetical protein